MRVRRPSRIRVGASALILAVLAGALSEAMAPPSVAAASMPSAVVLESGLAAFGVAGEAERGGTSIEGPWAGLPASGLGPGLLPAVCGQVHQDQGRGSILATTALTHPARAPPFFLS